MIVSVIMVAVLTMILLSLSLSLFPSTPPPPLPVVGAVALTMQPLWPDSTRAGMWYLSMGVFVLMGVMVTLIVGTFISFHLNLLSYKKSSTKLS